MLAHAQSYRRRLFVNCWHLGELESEAMWRIYCGREDGVAVVLPYNRLRDSLTEANTYIGAVNYIRFNVEVINSGDSYSLAMHKRKEFEYEQEARIVAWRIAPDSTPRSGPTFVEMDWRAEE